MRRAADVAHLSLPDEIRQRAKRLVDGYLERRAVDLVEIYVVGSETLEGFFARADEMQP